MICMLLGCVGGVLVGLREHSVRGRYAWKVLLP